MTLIDNISAGKEGEMFHILFCFFIGGMLGFAIAIIVALAIKAFFPYEHMFRGLVGVITELIAIPSLGKLFAIKFGKKP